MGNEFKKEDFVSKKDFKSALKNVNLMIIGLAIGLLYMWFFK